MDMMSKAQSPANRPSQSMSRAFDRHAGLITPFPHALAEAAVREWLAECVDDESHIHVWRCINRRLQFRMQRNLNPRFGFLLRDRKHAVLNILAPRSDYIAAALPGVEEQIKSQSRHRSNRMPRLTSCDLFFCPRMTLCSPHPWHGNAACRILLTERRIGIHCELEKPAKRIRQLSRRRWRALVHPIDDGFLAQPAHRPVAVCHTQPFENAPAQLLRSQRQLTKRKRRIVAGQRGIKRAR